MNKIQELIVKKQSKRNGKSLVFTDVNRDLITALFALSVYGKEARDEEIMTAILNASKPSGMEDIIARIRDNFEDMVSAGELKKTKTGCKDRDGFLRFEFL